MTEPASRLAADVWRRIFDFVVGTVDRRDRIMRELGLSPADVRSLSALGSEPRTMRSLAHEWRCDPSTATWLIDRLERAGLVRRRTATHDRRVKLVTLTLRGRRVKTRLDRGFYAPPRELLGVSPRSLAMLDRALASLPALSRPSPAIAPASRRRGRPRSAHDPRG